MTTTAAPGSRQAHREASERDKRARRFLLRLSLANWGIAVVAWTVSAFLGITSPARIIVYSVLFVIGLIAVVVALLTYLLEKFAHTPEQLASMTGEAGDADDLAGAEDTGEGGDTGEAGATAAASDAGCPRGRCVRQGRTRQERTLARSEPSAKSERRQGRTREASERPAKERTAAKGEPAAKE